MALDIRSNFNLQATLVANEFIDKYMISANGEYVKVYLYILRHEDENIGISSIADALDHTEADVRRALAYWEKLGTLRPVVSKEETIAEERPTDETAAEAVRPVQAASVPKEKRSAYTAEQVNQLALDEDFSQLLYIAQKYMNKVFTQRECEVFAYLYDSLHMSVELLEYLVEYCAQGGHNSLRYIETVALNWHEKGWTTAEEAKTYAVLFTKDVFSVMKAFGINDRKPGEGEKTMIETWFQTYGFGREIVVEACNRTIETTHNPSFKYADKILSEWKKAGVKNMDDIAKLDQLRKSQNAAKKDKQETKPKTNNRFHNFDQSSYDYDEMVWSMIKEK